MTILIDHSADLVMQAGELAVVREQDIPNWFLDSLKDSRTSSAQRAVDIHRVCSIPTALVEKWQREGFDVMKEPARAIVARLKAQGYEHFLATDKVI